MFFLVLIAGVMLTVMGCRMLATGTYLTVGTAAVAGYTVYQGGKKAVISVQKVTEKGTRGVGEVVFSYGKFKTQCPYPVERIYLAAGQVFNDLHFRRIRGKYDAFTGIVAAETVEGKELSLNLRLVEDSLTEIEIRIGSKGNLKNSEFVYDRILIELEQRKGR